MAVFAGPEINESGLVLSVDAGNTKSLLNTVEVLVVAGGGGGGMDMGGGGGGGGVIYSSTVSVTPGVAHTVTVGSGGYGAPGGSGGYRTDGAGPQPGGHQFTISATNGGNSVFGSLTAIGGGFGASSYYGYTPNYGYGGTGGSGGGCSGYTHGGERYVDSNGTPGQGYPGGNSGNPASSGDDHYSGGGGGAGGRGTSGPNHIGPNGVRADGGPGVCYPNMSPYYFAGGGGGSAYVNSTGGYGGIGGGGGGAVGTTYGGAGLNDGSPGGGGSPYSQTNTPGGNAGANTGGGGGGGSHYYANNKGGEGGSGIVFVRYPGVQRATGGTVTSSGGYTIHTFTTVGSSTFTPLTLADLSGNGNTGTLTNGPTYSSANGGSLVFDGTNDYSSHPYSSLLDLGTQFTISSFIKFNNLSTISPIFAAPNVNVGVFTEGYMFYYNTGTIYGVNTNTLRLQFGQNNWAWNLYASNGITITDNNWHFVSVTASNLNTSNPTITFYIDGNSITGTFWNAGSKAAIRYSSNINSPRVASIFYPSSPSYDGPYYGNNNIATTSIYNRALSAAEVLQNFNANRFRYGL